MWWAVSGRRIINSTFSTPTGSIALTIGVTDMQNRLLIAALMACSCLSVSNALAATAPNQSITSMLPSAAHSSASDKTAPANIRLAYGCDAGQCTCHGDDDCNNMYSGGSCKQTGSCETSGGTSCTCATQAKANTTSIGKVIKKPPELLKKQAEAKSTAHKTSTTEHKPVEKKDTEKKP
jgi:hypothetical protein